MRNYMIFIALFLIPLFANLSGIGATLVITGIFVIYYLDQIVTKLYEKEGKDENMSKVQKLKSS